MASAILKTRAALVLREERGMTLVELLIATAMFLIVAATAMFVVLIVMQNQHRISDRTAAIQEGRVLEERFTRELRSGYGITTATSTQVSFITYVRRTACGSTTALASSSPAIPCKVTYALSSGAITRTETNPAGTATPWTQTEASGLSNTDVFSYLPNAAAPGYVSVKLVFPAQGGNDAVTLVDGTDLRNG
jgi:prepilin-type N-terminal cleavage/methylation domain-containing protein